MANEYTKHQIKNVRCAYAFLAEPNPKNPKFYTVKLMLPKNTPETNATINLLENLAEKRFGKKQAAYATGQIQDGDMPSKPGMPVTPEFAGHWLLNPKTLVNGKKKFALVDRNRNPITDPAQIYGGIWININLAIDAYKHPQYGNKFAIYINGVQKVKDDTPLFYGSIEDQDGGFDDLDNDESTMV